MPKVPGLYQSPLLGLPGSVPNYVGIDWAADHKQVWYQWWANAYTTSQVTMHNIAATWNANPITTSGTTTYSNAVLQAVYSFQNTVWNNWAPRAVVTAEQREAWARMEAERDQQQAAADEANAMRVREAAAASAKADKLLIKYLTEEQRRTLAEKKYFDVKVGGKTYRLNYGTHGNIRELDASGREIATYCIQPDGVPTGDAVLAQKLLLESDAEAFFRIANKRPLYVPPTEVVLRL